KVCTASLGTILCVAVGCSPLNLQHKDALPPGYRDFFVIENRSDFLGKFNVAIDKRDGDEEKLPIVVPLKIRHGVPFIPVVLHGFGTPPEMTVNVMVDTGSRSAVSIPRLRTDALRPWLSADVEPARSTGAFGNHRKYWGLIPGLHVGTLWIVPLHVD